jgi:hypothetical protein
MVLAAAGLFVVSAVVTLIILLISGGGRKGVVSPEPDSAVSRGVEIGIADLMMPKTALSEKPKTALSEKPGEAPPYLLRERMNRWNEELVRRYWIPLNEIALDQMVEENDRRIEELLEEVP